MQTQSSTESIQLSEQEESKQPSCLTERQPGALSTPCEDPVKEAVPLASEGDENEHSNGLEEYLFLCKSNKTGLSIKSLVNSA